MKASKNENLNTTENVPKQTAVNPDEGTVTFFTKNLIDPFTKVEIGPIYSLLNPPDLERFIGLFESNFPPNKPITDYKKRLLKFINTNVYDANGKIIRCAFKSREALITYCLEQSENAFKF